MRHARIAALAVLMIASVASRAVHAASQFDPRYRFKRLPTEHFIIYFHQGEDRLASRLAVVAEEAWHKLERPLGTRPPPLTHVVIVDQTEFANGFAFPLPRDTIVLNAVVPAGSELIGNFDDWLTLVFTHEFTHIVHLDRSEGWARIVRNVFGRIGLAFPNVFLPQWQIEGLATYEESAITGEGRLHAGDFRAIVAEDARAHDLAPLDRVNGGLVDWPGGLAHYAYGVGFHAYLAEHYGEAKLAELARTTARWVPYTASRAFVRVYGRSLGELWREYQRSVMASVPATATRAPELVTQLTRHGFIATGPRFLPAACAGCPADVIYSERTPHGFPTLNRLTPSGSGASDPRVLATRYLGDTTANGRQATYFDQAEVRRNVGVYNDLYALDRASGHVRRLTSGARLVDPDLSPDEQTIVAAQNTQPGQRDLVLVRLKPDSVRDGATPLITSLIAGPDTEFNAPRWSPDGRTIAVERHRLGAHSEIVVVDVATRRIRILASDADTRWATPAWRPDGRAIVAAADQNGETFNLYEIDIDAPAAPRQLTHTTGGATWPDVSPDGASIVYVGYTTAGYDVFQVPYPAPLKRPRTGEADAEHDVGHDEGHDVGHDFSRAGAGTEAPLNYSPWPTLGPTSWSPTVNGDHTQLRIGAATGGSDVLGYHGYGVSVSWLVSSPSDAPSVDAATPDWQVFYVYDRWRPTFWASASRDTSFFGGPPSDTGVPATATLRERQLQAGVVLPIRRVRVSQALAASVVRAADEFTLPDRIISRDRTATRAAWNVTSAITYGYSISPERGVAAGITAEAVRRAFGASGDASAGTADVRAYLPGLAPHHVLAVRLAGGASTGDRDLRRAFNLGGALSNVPTVDFGREAISLLRGFPADSFAGSRVALLNAEYRFPIARPQRGAGTWPFFLRTVHAAAFADAGHAWTRAFSSHDLKTSAGGELSIDFVAAYSLPFTASVGAAWGHDGSHTLADRATVYFRLGHAF